MIKAHTAIISITAYHVQDFKSIIPHFEPKEYIDKKYCPWMGAEQWILFFEFESVSQRDEYVEWIKSKKQRFQHWYLSHNKPTEERVYFYLSDLIDHDDKRWDDEFFNFWTN